MDVFCLVFPDAVLSSRALKIAVAFQRAGIEIVEKSIRILTVEEAKTIFHTRRMNNDFEDFCKALTITNSWMLHLRGDDEDLIEGIYEILSDEESEDIFVPDIDEDHELFLKLIHGSKYNPSSLPQIVDELRRKYAEQEGYRDMAFSSIALHQGSQIYNYYVAMLINGFDEQQSFTLAKNFQKSLVKRAFREEEEADEYDDDDEDSLLDD